MLISNVARIGVGNRGASGRSDTVDAAEIDPKSAGKTKAQITKRDLVDFFSSGCKPKSEWRIGTEHEKFCFNVADHKRATYEQIREIIEEVAEEKGWTPIVEGDNVIGCKGDGQSITLEPGGQFELSGAPVKTIHDVSQEIREHLRIVDRIAEHIGVEFVGSGYDPTSKVSQIPAMPKERYHIIAKFLPKVGSLGLDLMYKTCSTQVNLDFSSEEDMVDKLRVSLALQPVATALFANSPFSEGKPNGYQSFRSQTYLNFDDVRCGLLPFVFEDGFGFEKYVDYLLDVPMYAVYREDEGYIDAIGMSFRDFMEGNLPCLPGEFPTIKDWELHVGSVYPEVRLKKFLEMRGADCGSTETLICALPAFWVGLLYDSQALEQCKSIIADLTIAELEYLRREVPKTGLKTPFRNGTILSLARKVVEVAIGGLQRRGMDEELYLDQIREVAESGISISDRLLEAYNTVWSKHVDPLFDRHL